MRGKSSKARKKSSRAAGSKLLNRRRRSHIRGDDLEQAVFNQVAQEFREVSTQQFSLNIVFVQQLPVSDFHAGRGGYQLPHACAGLVQAEIALCLDVQENR